MVREKRDMISTSRGCGGGDMNEKPAWLERLMAETFFGACGVHEDRRKNEKNVFCLHCCLSICPHCLSSHRSHPLLQVLYYSITTMLHANSLLNSLFFFSSPFHSNPKKLPFFILPWCPLPLFFCLSPCLPSNFKRASADSSRDAVFLSKFTLFLPPPIV